jgi:hypothetical protein
VSTSLVERRGKEGEHRHHQQQQIKQTDCRSPLPAIQSALLLSAARPRFDLSREDIPVSGQGMRIERDDRLRR